MAAGAVPAREAEQRLESGAPGAMSRARRGGDDRAASLPRREGRHRNRPLSAVQAMPERRAAPASTHPSRGYESDSAAFEKRPACDFSALARVSNQSAISVKPSSRAVFAIPGYMSVYS